MSFPMKPVALLMYASALCATLGPLAGCSDKAPPPAASGPAAATTAPAAMAASGPAASASATPGPPVSVVTVKAQKKDMAVTLKSTGTVTPQSSVDVRAQTNSTVSKVHISEGQFVKAGQLLFTLDARTDEANVAKARAQLNKDNASLIDGRRQLQRAQELFAQNFISQGALDTVRAQTEALSATVAADQAALNASQVALSFSRITAPQAGRAGGINVFAGSAVMANQTPLVTITQLDPIAVQFTIAQRNLSSALSALQKGAAPVTATLADGGGSFQGKLQFIDNAVDPSSGAVKAKALFANKESKLWPGAFVEVQQTVSTLKDATVVPQAAIIVGTRGTIVYVVEGGKAVLRPVKVVHADNGDAAITGVQPGETVVLDGKQNVRPNSLVQERAPAPKTSASAPATPASKAPAP